MKKFLLLSSALVLTGCLAALVPDSSDPKVLMNTGLYHMNETKRGWPASKAFDKAIKICREKKDIDCEAEGHFSNGMLYKIVPYLASPPKSIKGISYMDFSEKSFKRAIFLWKKNKNYGGVARSYFGLAKLYLNLKDGNETACKKWDKSLVFYRKAKENGTDKMSINPNFKSFPEMVHAYKKEYCK